LCLEIRLTVDPVSVLCCPPFSTFHRQCETRFTRSPSYLSARHFPATCSVEGVDAWASVC